MDTTVVPEKCRRIGLHIPGAGSLIGECLALSGIGLVYWIIASQYFRQGFVDDTFISLRYLKHFVEGHGLVWNVGEPPLEGFTNLGWILLLSLFGTSDLEALQVIARLAGIVCGLGVLVLLWLATRSLVPGALPKPVALVVPLHLAFTPIFARHAVSGMETMFTALLLSALIGLWCTAFHKRSQVSFWIIGAMLTFLSGLARPDAVLFGVAGSSALLLLMCLQREQWLRAMLGFGITFGGLLAIFLLWKQIYFSHLIPLPAYMKQDTLRIFASIHSINFVAGHWLGYIKQVAPLLLISSIAILYGILPLRNGLAAVGVGAGIYGVYFLSVWPVMSIHWRYLFPTYPALVLIGFIALCCLLAHRKQGTPTRTGWGHTTGMLIVLTLFSFYNIGAFPDVKRETREQYVAYVPLGEIGKRLATIPGLSLAHSEAGQLPYFSQHRFLDIAGLNDFFMAMNRFHSDNFDKLYLDYLVNHVGLPDVYFNPSPEHDYARMENIGLMDYYERFLVNHAELFVLKSSPHFTQIADVLGTSKNDSPSTPTNCARRPMRSRTTSPRKTFFEGGRRYGPSPRYNPNDSPQAQVRAACGLRKWKPLPSRPSVKSSSAPST